MDKRVAASVQNESEKKMEFDLRPAFKDIMDARKHVYRFLHRTPLHSYAGLDELVGTDVYVKHENHHAVGSFKVRGGVNLAAHLTDAERKAGLFTASTGNHGQSIAFAGMVSKAPVKVSLPEGANPGKMAAIRRLGAEVLVHGRDFDEAREWIMNEAKMNGARFIGPTDELLIAGVGTYGLEIVEDVPDVDVIVVPIGAGSGAAATCIAAKTINPDIQVIGVQAKKACAVQLSWKAGHIVSAPMESRSEGVATRVAHENTLQILRHPKLGLDDFVLVSDEAQEQSVRLLLEHTHNLAETAGAASLAAALELRERLAGKKVVLVLSGGNITTAQLHRILSN
jgi:threonine dehydratase